MVNKKITELNELAAQPASTDTIAIVDDPGGSPETKYITIANLHSGLGGGTRTTTTNLIFEIPDSTSAYPDILSMTNRKVDGFVLPDNLDGKFHFKCIVPEDIAGTPAAQIILWFAPTGASTAGNARITVNRLFVGSTETMDGAGTDETEQSIAISATAEVTVKATFTLAASPTAGELLLGTVTRQALADSLDTYEADIICVGGVLLIDQADP